MGRRGREGDPRIRDHRERRRAQPRRPFHRDANAAVHAGSRRLSQRLGVEDAAQTWLTGMSNAGLDGPVRSTAISLMQVTVTTLLHRRSADNVVLAQVATALSHDADDGFIAAAAELERRIAQEEKHEGALARRVAGIGNASLRTARAAVSTSTSPRPTRGPDGRRRGPHLLDRRPNMKAGRSPAS